LASRAPLTAYFVRRRCCKRPSAAPVLCLVTTHDAISGTIPRFYPRRRNTLHRWLPVQRRVELKVAYLVWHTNRLRQQHRRTSLPTFNSSQSTVVISAHLFREHSLFHARVPLSATEVCVEQFTGYYKTYHQLQTVLATSENTFI